ncbi:MAG: NADH-quinone oxidoreductase subunit A [Candidatus Thorarchaeota archaeon]
MDFLPVLVWALLAVVLVIVMLLASWVLRPHTIQNSEKTSPYECGEEPIGPARITYPYNYIVYTILFVVVDVMTAMLWLLSVTTWRLMPAAVWQMLIFVCIVMVGIAFVIKVIPSTTLDGKETLELYREAKAARAVAEQEAGGSH